MISFSGEFYVNTVLSNYPNIQEVIESIKTQPPFTPKIYQKKWQFAHLCESARAARSLDISRAALIILLGN